MDSRVILPKCLAAAPPAPCSHARTHALRPRSPEAAAAAEPRRPGARQGRAQGSRGKGGGRARSPGGPGTSGAGSLGRARKGRRAPPRSHAAFSPPPPPDAHPARLPGAPRLLSARPPPRHTHTFSPFSELEHRSGRGRRRREEEEEDGRRGRAQRKGRDRGPSWTARALLAPPPTARPARRPPPSVRAPARRSRPLERVRQADTDLRLPLGCRGVVGENMAASACPLAAGAAGALPGAHALRSGPLCSRAALSYF